MSGSMPVQPPRQPPVGVAHQLHRRRDEDQAHDGRVERDRDRQPDADLLDLRDAGAGEDREHGDHDQRGAGDRLRAGLQALGDGPPVVAGGLVALLDAREHEDLVVHREAEDDRQQQRGRDRLHVAERLEAEEAVEPAPLEDDHEHAVGRRDRQHVHRHRLQRQQHAAQHAQQDDEAEHDDEQPDLPQRAGDDRGVVLVLGGGAADADRRAGRAGRLAQALDQRDRRSRSRACRSGIDREQDLVAAAGGDRAGHLLHARQAAQRLDVGRQRRPGRSAARPKSTSTWTGPVAPGPSSLRGQLEALAGLEALREHRDRRRALLQRQRGRGDQQHQRGRGERERQRPLHQRLRPALPEARAGLGLAACAAGAR